MKTLCLYAVLAAAACVPVDKTPRASDTTSAADTTPGAAAPATPVTPGVSPTPSTSPSAPHPPTPSTPAPLATKVATVAGFPAPQAALHDSTQDIYFVASITGSPTAKTNTGFISRVRPDGAVENLKFVEGGHNAVTLNAPKGLALRGDTLWVADIDALRAFDARTGAPRDSVSLASLGAVFLSDIAIAPTGALYVTDAGIRFDDVGNVLHPGPDRIFRVGPDRKITIAIRGDTLNRPSGIALDLTGKRFIVAPFGGKSVFAWKPEDKAPKVVAKGAGAFDGVVVAGSRLFVASWNDSTVSSYETEQEVKVVTGVPTPGVIGYDAKRNRLLIPIVTGNRVEIWQLP